MNLSSLKSFAKQFPFVYPARIIQSCREWIDRENSKSGIYGGIRKHSYALIEQPEHYTFKMPDLDNVDDTNKFAPNLFYQTPASYLYNLKDCYLYKTMGLVLTRRNALFQEFTHHFGISSLKRFILKHPFFTFSSKIKNVSGTGAVLVSPQSHNYYHWLFDVLPRIKSYQSVNSHISHYCIADNVPQKFLDVLDAFGIAQDKVFRVSDTEKLHFDNLYVASLPGSEGRTPKWAVDYVRETLLKNVTEQAARKIYFKRDSNIQRKILNEEELIAALLQEGFEIIGPDNLSIHEQVELMQQSAVVVGLHSAALANLMFAKPGTKVIELFSPDYFRTDCYFTLACMLDLDYQYLAGTKPANADWGDIEVDVALLKEKIRT